MIANIKITLKMISRCSFSCRLADLAVDGDDNPALNHAYGSCTHTLLDSSPWFVVDLGQEEAVTGVAIVNRDTSSK